MRYTLITCGRQNKKKVVFSCDRTQRNSSSISSYSLAHSVLLNDMFEPTEMGKKKKSTNLFLGVGCLSTSRERLIFMDARSHLRSLSPAKLNYFNWSMLCILNYMIDCQVFVTDYLECNSIFC